MEDSHPDTWHRRLFDVAIAELLRQALRIIRVDLLPAPGPRR